MFKSVNIPEEAKSKEFKEIENKLCGVPAETFTEEKTATGEILINKAEFDAAAHKVMEDQMNDPKLEGMSKFLVTLTGRVFAEKMKEILFPEKPENKEVE